MVRIDIESNSAQDLARETEIRSTSAELNVTASDPALTEDLALALLKRTDLPPEVFERLSKNAAVSRSHKVKLAIAGHPKAPRHVSLPLLRHLFTFEWMQLALAPSAPADVKVAAEAALTNRLETISLGERISLAHRASGSIAAALLLDAEPRVLQAALENPRLTESVIVKSLMGEASAALVGLVCHHPKWSLRKDVRIALLRNEHTSLSRAQEFARSLPPSLVQEILQSSRLPEDVKAVLGDGR